MKDRFVWKNQKGFTLIELLMVAFMLALMLVPLYSLFVSSQRHSYVQEEVADVQQNLRVAVDSITRDVRNAGFLITRFYNTLQTGAGSARSATNGNVEQTVRTIATNIANSAGLPATRDVLTAATAIHADMLTLNIAAPEIVFARTNTAVTWPAGMGDVTFTLTNPEATDLFRIDPNDPEYVRVINPITHRQITSPDAEDGPDTGTVFSVVNKDRATSTIVLRRDQGLLPDNKLFMQHAVILRISSVNRGVYPASVTYCLGNETTVGCTAPANQCPRRNATDPSMCLVRIVQGASQVVATGLTGLQLSYLLDDGTEVPNAMVNIGAIADFTPIRAIRVNVTGQTASSGSLTNLNEHVRSLTSIIKLQNRLMLY